MTHLWAKFEKFILKLKKNAYKIFFKCFHSSSIFEVWNQWTIFSLNDPGTWPTSVRLVSNSGVWGTFLKIGFVTFSATKNSAAKIKWDLFVDQIDKIVATSSVRNICTNFAIQNTIVPQILFRFVATRWSRWTWGNIISSH